MSERTLRWLDAGSAGLLLLWSGLALGIAVLAAPVAFHQLPSRDLAGRVIGACLRRVDLLAWFAFGLAFLASYGSRWFAEIRSPGQVIGPLQLWNAAALAALLMCFTSAAIVAPRMETLRSRMAGPIETLPVDNPDRAAFGRAHAISMQLLVLRVLLAIGLAIGVRSLPTRAGEDRES